MRKTRARKPDPEGPATEEANRQAQTTSRLEAGYLPAEADDPRENRGWTSKGKRRTARTISTGHTDPSRRAERRLSGSWRISDSTGKETPGEEQRSPWGPTWNANSQRRAETGQGTSGEVRWKRDESLKQGEIWIKHQPWAQNSVERITAGDFEDYWAVLDQRRTPTNDMGGTKQHRRR